MSAAANSGAERPASVVIIGGGLAGAKTAEHLRERGYDGPVTLLSAETELPYERPPLSKSYLAGESEFDKALVKPGDWYADNGVDLRLNTEVRAIDRDASQVELADGERLDYGALVLATGSEPRRLPIPGAESALTLRTRQDSDTIRATFGEGKRLVIVGAGWIGLEVAAAARAHGTDVTILEVADQPLLNVLGPQLGAVFAQLHRDHGVDLRLGVSIEELGARPRLADGSSFDADAVLLGVGVQPRTDLAAAAGLAVDRGVLVDASLRTSDPKIFAVGDIANHDHPVLEQRVRVEHWATALKQPATAVAAILGSTEEYRDLPYFFSDQYDLGMEYIGHVPPQTSPRVVVRGDLDGREFVAFWLDDGDHLLAAMNVNVWDVVDELKPIIAERRPVDQQKLADPDVAYAEVGK